MSFKIKMRSKLMIIFSLIVIIPILFLGYNIVQDEKRVIKEQILKDNLGITKMIAQLIYQIAEDMRRAIIMTASLPEMKKMDVSQITPLLKKLAAEYEFIQTLYVVDRNKKQFVNTDGKLYSMPKNWSFSMVNKKSYLGAVSNVFLSKITGKPIINIETIIRGHDSQILGALCAEINLEYINKIIERVELGKTGYIYVVDKEGKVIATTSNKIIAQEKSIKEVNFAVKKVLKGEDGGMEINWHGGSYLAAFSSVKKIDGYKGPDWGVVAEQTTKEAYLPAETMKNKIIVMALFCVLAALAVAIFFAYTITTPLRKLVEEVQTISAGNLDHKVDILTGDEIGDLSNKFDRMRRHLKFRMIELEKLYKVGQAISSVLNFEELLNLILDMIIEEIGADQGSIMLLDDDEQNLTIAVARHLTNDIISNTKVAIGIGIVGRVAQTGERIMIEDAEKSDKLKDLKGEEGIIRKGCLLSVPLKVKDKILGVINISKSDPHSFSLKDLDFFSGLATQASIAISNAKLYRMATTDGLTQLYINRYFQQKLDEELVRAERYNNPVGLIMMDIDHFKNFNDTYGHQTGDECLKAVARLVEKSVRNLDIAARYGGEEFVVICPEMDAEGTLYPAERIRTAIESFEFLVDGKRVPITISLGVSSFPQDAKEKTSLIKRADEALYACKERGRNCVTAYHQLKDFGMEVPESEKEV